MKEQKVIFTIKPEGDELNISIAFEPTIAGEKSEACASMNKKEKYMQNYAAHIGAKIMKMLMGEK